MIHDRQAQDDCHLHVDGATPEGIKASTHVFIPYLSLMNTGGGLWSLFGLRGLLLRRKHLY